MEDILLYIVICLAVVIITLVFWIAHIQKRLSSLCLGKGAQSLESIIKDNNLSLSEVKKVQEKHHGKILDLQEKMLDTIQHIGVVRFNPFKDTGGSQSFAIALTNEHKDGVIISSLYARERVSIFAKPIKGGTSAFKLTDEEQQAITEAHK